MPEKLLAYRVFVDKKGYFAKVKKGIGFVKEEEQAALFVEKERAEEISAKIKSLGNLAKVEQVEVEKGA
jgi:sulfatase maturation enzyme AslB (radical SAM superfamily)